MLVSLQKPVDAFHLQTQGNKPKNHLHEAPVKFCLVVGPCWDSLALHQTLQYETLQNARSTFYF